MGRPKRSNLHVIRAKTRCAPIRIILYNIVTTGKFRVLTQCNTIHKSMKVNYVMSTLPFRDTWGTLLSMKHIIFMQV